MLKSFCDRFVKNKEPGSSGEPASSYRKQAILLKGFLRKRGSSRFIVAAQVYTSLVNVSANVLAHFQQKGSDSLYELRFSSIRTGCCGRATLTKNVDSEGAHEVVKAIKEFSMTKLPDGFSSHPGDAVATSVGSRLGKGRSPRTRLIARGLNFVHSESPTN